MSHRSNCMSGTPKSGSRRVFSLGVPYSEQRGAKKKTHRATTVTTINSNPNTQNRPTCWPPTTSSPICCSRHAFSGRVFLGRGGHHDGAYGRAGGEDRGAPEAVPRRAILRGGKFVYPTHRPRLGRCLAGCIVGFHVARETASIRSAFCRLPRHPLCSVA